MTNKQVTVGNTSNVSRRDYIKPGKICGCLQWLCREVQISSCRYLKRLDHDVLVDMWKYHWQHPHCSTSIFPNSRSYIYIKHKTRLHFKAMSKLAISWQVFWIFSPTRILLCVLYFISKDDQDTTKLYFNILWFWRFSGNI